MYDPAKLRQIMEAQGRRVDWLAEVTEYDRSTVSRIINGSQPMSDRFAMRAARVLGCPVDWLSTACAAELEPSNAA